MTDFYQGLLIGSVAVTGCWMVIIILATMTHGTDNIVPKLKDGGFIPPLILSGKKMRAYVPSDDPTKVMMGQEEDQFKEDKG